MVRAGRLLLMTAVCVLMLAGIAVAQKRSDTDIAAELQKRIQPGTGVTFTVRDGVVTLTGTVSSYAQKTSITEIARRVVGVREVVDHINVVPSVKRTDAEILRSVRSVLVGNLSRSEISAINVKVQNGIVILTGTLTNSYPKQIAGILAGWIPGVAGVRNEITVKPDVLRNDLNIQADITGRFRKNPFISGQKINVMVRNGVVTLQGIVDNEMIADQAESVARFTPGVVDVNNLLFIRGKGM